MTFRDVRLSREDPEVLAAQSREKYAKVLNIVSGLFFFVRSYVNLTLFHCDIDQVSGFVIFLPKLILAFQLKSKLQTLTLGIGGVGLVSTYVSYSPEIAARYLILHAFISEHLTSFVLRFIIHVCLNIPFFHVFSFGAGWLGSLAYMRMLGSSMDSLRINGAKSFVK